MGPSVPEEASVFEDRRGSGWDRRCVKQQKRLQKQTFSNQRPNALDSANLAPAVSARGRPHTDLGEWKNWFLHGTSEENKIVVKMKGVSI